MGSQTFITLALDMVMALKRSLEHWIPVENGCANEGVKGEWGGCDTGNDGGENHDGGERTTTVRTRTVARGR
jgi:hypothetical protein